MRAARVVMLLALIEGCKSGHADPPVADAGARSGAAAAHVNRPDSAFTVIPDRIRRLREQRSSPKCPAGMAFVPGGTFKMGSVGNESSDFTTYPTFEGERHFMTPAHVVSVQSFCIDLAPVTVAEYSACVARGACAAPPRQDDPQCRKPGDCVLDQTKDNSLAYAGKPCNWTLPGHAEYPEECVDWKEAQRYCEQVSRRLPTEKEWERAARGTDERFVAYGTPQTDPGTCADAPTKEVTCPVASYPGARSPYGLFDMAFAPREWTATHYCQYPREVCGGLEISVRGGLAAHQALTTSREPVAPEVRKIDLTFRCAAEPVAP
jgi:formylglycine-generating enzyme required for sulfatase activity